MENKDAQLIRKMMSLVESADKKASQLISESEENNTPEVETDIDESIVKTVAADAEMLANVLRNEKGLFSTLKSEVPALAKFKSADELLAALKSDSGLLTTADRFKIIKQVRQVPEVAMKVRGLLSKSKNVQTMGQLAYPKGIGMAADPAKLKIAREALVKSYGMSAQEAEALLKQAAQEAKGTGGVAAKSIDKALARRGAADAGKVGADAGKVGGDIGKTTKPIIGNSKWDPRKYWDRAKEFTKKYKGGVLEKIQKLRGRLNAKQLALYGLAGYGAYEMLFGKSGGEEGKNTETVLPDCVANLPEVQFGIGTGDVAIATIPNGVDEKSNDHGGITFWPNGRAITGDGQVRGTYYCKGEVVTADVAEGLWDSIKNGVVDGAKDIKSATAPGGSDVDYQGVHIHWDGSGDGTTPVPTPTPKPQPMYKKCNDFPMTPGCKSDYIREIQVCLGMPQKYQTGNFGPITKSGLSKGGYDSSSIDRDTYIKIISNCGGKKAEPTTGSTIPNVTLPTLKLNTPKYSGPTPEQIQADLAAIQNRKYAPTEPSAERQAEIIRGVKDRGFDMVYKGANLNDLEKQWLLKHYNANAINKEKQKGDGQEKLRFK
jgi:hypothetical protein